jgi:1-acyl-sn-glycerol-3-phosphate acyltransferase
MSDLHYDIVRGVCYPVYWVTSRPVILHKTRADRAGAYILAPNHLSPYDVPALIGASPRRLDFLSIVEMERKPIVRPLFRGMNCEFVDRGRIDTVAVRALTRRLQRGRVIAMFPESGIRTLETSVLNGGRIKPGCVHLAQITGAPIIPCAIVGTKQWSKFTSWLPLRRTVFGLNFGEPIHVPADPDPQAQRRLAADRLTAAYRKLYEELNEAMGGKRKALEVL